jgi:SOS-response transcriptional repressor LexA
MNTELQQVQITDRQREVLGFIARFYADHGYALTVRQICKQFRFASPNAAVAHLKALRRHGLATWQSGKARTIRPTEAGLSLLEGGSDA